MELNENEEIGIVIISISSLISSITVFAILIKMPNKEFSTYISLQLIFYDMLISLSNMIYLSFIHNLPLWQYYAFYFIVFAYSRLTHNVLISYIAISLYKIVIQKVTITGSSVLKFTIISTILVILLLAFIFTIYVIHSPEWINIAQIIIYLLVFPNIFVFIIIIVCYIQIRKTLYNYLQSSELSLAIKNIPGIRLFIFPILYVFAIISFWLARILSITNNNYDIALTVEFFAFAIYPFCNSVAYGITENFKRYLFAICLNDPKYQEIEENIKKKRDDNELNPRPYFDLLGISETLLINEYKFNE